MPCLLANLGKKGNLMDEYPFVAVGERMTLTVAIGLTWHGTLVDLHHSPDGLLACVRLLPEGDSEPLAINADQIVAWRRGEPVRKPQAVEVPAGLLNGPGPMPFRGRG